MGDLPQLCNFYANKTNDGKIGKQVTNMHNACAKKCSKNS